MLNGPVFNNEVVQANSRAVNNAGFSESLDEANSLYSRLTGASFELVPSSYKGGVVYSGVPNTGNGDLTWTRASDAWRTNADGLIQRVPWNLTTYSEDFTNANWTKSATSVSSNSITAPNGTATADTLTADGTSARHFVGNSTMSIISGTTYTLSIYAKKNTNNFIQLGGGFAGFGSNVFANFDLNNGTIGTIGSSATATITNVGDGWYRCTITGTATSTLSGIVVVYEIVSSATSGRSEVNTLSTSVYIWGAQLVEGSSAQTYLPTTDRLNVPRLSYMYGSCPALFLEPQRTNISTQSTIATFGTAANDWVIGINVPAVVNQTIGIDGRLTGTRYTKSSGGTTADFLYKKEIPVTSGTVYTVSGYIKLGTASNAVIVVNNTLSWNTVTNGTFVCTTANGFSTTEWKRFAMTVTAPATGKINIHYGYHIEVGLPAQTDGTFFLDGLQVEQGAYATTLIPTVATSVTRLADQFTRNNIYTNGLITAAGGTWFVELRNNISYTRDNGSNTLILSDSIGTTSFRFRNDGTPNTTLRLQKIISGTGTELFYVTTATAKILFKWNGTTADVFVNGIKVISNTSFAVTQLQDLSANPQVPLFIQQMALFPTPLSDDQCVALTSDFTEGESVIGSYERYVNSNGGSVENLNTITNLIQNLK